LAVDGEVNEIRIRHAISYIVDIIILNGRKSSQYHSRVGYATVKLHLKAGSQL